jgi:hypothetical protein
MAEALPPNPPDIRPVTDLQFQSAEPIAGQAGSQISATRCAACKQPVIGQYFHAAGQVVCPGCAERIQTGQQAPPPISLLPAVLYGLGAAVLGSALYATVAIVTGLAIGLVAIVIGVMVGKAVRHASGGLGGRPQQILAVVLTYFSITTSYIPVAIYEFSKNPRPAAQSTGQAQTHSGSSATPGSTTKAAGPASFGTALFFLLLLALAAPFFGLTSISGLITLFIIYIGLRRAWLLTGRSNILVMGPYEPSPAS